MGSCYPRLCLLLPLLTDDGSSLRGTELLYFHRDDPAQHEPSRVASNKVPLYYSDLKEGSLSTHVEQHAEQTAQLVCAHTVYHIPEIVERIQRRIVKNPYPPSNKLRGEHQKQQACVPISLSMGGRACSRTLTSILKFLYEQCDAFHTLVDGLQEEKKPLRMVLYVNDAQHTIAPGIVTLSVKLLHQLSQHITIHSAYSVPPLCMSWSVKEDPKELIEAFAPTLSEVAHIIQSGIALGGSPTPLATHCVLSCQQKMVQTLCGVNSTKCMHCGVKVADLKDPTPDPHTKYALGPTSLEDLRARVVPPARVLLDSLQSVFDVCPDLLLLTHNVLNSLLEPVFLLASEHASVREAFVHFVRAECGLPHFGFHTVSSLDLDHLRKIFSKLSVPSIVTSAQLSETAKCIEFTLNLSDKLLHALYSKPSDASYLTPETYKTLSKKAEYAFRVTHMNDRMTKDMHIFFHHMHQFLEYHETIHPFSTQACEASPLSGRGRGSHHHHATHQKPDLNRHMQIQNKLLYGVAHDLISALYSQHKGPDSAESEDEGEMDMHALEQVMGSWVPRPSKAPAAAAPAPAAAAAAAAAAAEEKAVTPASALVAAAAAAAEAAAASAAVGAAPPAPTPAAPMDEPTPMSVGDSATHRTSKARDSYTDSNVPAASAPAATTATATVSSKSSGAAAAKRTRRK